MAKALELAVPGRGGGERLDFCARQLAGAE